MAIGGLAALHGTRLCAAQPPAVLGSFSDGNLAFVLPQPDVGLPAPAQLTGSGFGGAVRPHGIDFLRVGEALVADFTIPQLSRLRVSSGTVIGSIALSTRTNASGTVAVSPNGNFVLSFGETSASGVGFPESAIVSGFATGHLQVQAGPANIQVRRFVTAAIDFAPNGRAYVCHTNGVAALDPPYTSTVFSVTLPQAFSTSVCRLSRDGQRLFVTRASAGIGVVAAPFSASSVPVSIAAPAGVGGLGPIGVSPDGNAVLIGQLNAAVVGQTKARLFLLRAPYTAASVMQELTLPASISGASCTATQGGNTICPGFEDISISPDGLLALVTGNSTLADTNSTGRAPLLAITHPFDDATRAFHAVTIGTAGQNSEGRGTGGVRIEPADLRIFADSFE
ncbi:MAG: hypothetical protein ABI411_04040 [Tahibacter sp.]